MKPLQVLIIEDSQVMQKKLCDVFSGEPDLEVLDIASDPIEARDTIVKKRPDVITLDIEMPRMDGVTFLKRLMNYDQIPVVMVSSYTKSNSIQTIHALEAGAFDFVTKPSYQEDWSQEFWNEILIKVRAAGRARIQKQMPVLAPHTEFNDLVHVPRPMLIAIGASTGGMSVIKKILSRINFMTKGILVSMHLPARYVSSFSQRLNERLPMKVKVASDKDEIESGTVLVGPGGENMRVIRHGRGHQVRLEDLSYQPHEKNSIDVLFHSVAENVGKEAVGIILTGMGSDGAEGLAAMKKYGAFTIAQNEESCVVYGMPNAAISIGGASRILAPERIPGVIKNYSCQN